MAFCAKCGAQNYDSNVFCGSCDFALARSSTPSEPPAYVGYARFWKRFGAALIDGILLNIVMTAFGYIVACAS